MNIFMQLLKSIVRPKSRPVTPSKPTQVHQIDLIKKHEGLRLKAYLPTAYDVWTIGYGHTHTARKGMVITESEAERLLRVDLKWVEETLAALVSVPLTQNQYDALASFIFNLGRTNFNGSTLRRKINTYDYVGAADEFLKWNKQRQGGKLKVLRGLTKRRKEERALFLKGTK